MEALNGPIPHGWTKIQTLMSAQLMVSPSTCDDENQPTIYRPPQNNGSLSIPPRIASSYLVLLLHLLRSRTSGIKWHIFCGLFVLPVTRMTESKQ